MNILITCTKFEQNDHFWYRRKFHGIYDSKTTSSWSNVGNICSGQERFLAELVCLCSCYKATHVLCCVVLWARFFFQFSAYLALSASMAHGSAPFRHLFEKKFQNVLNKYLRLFLRPKFWYVWPNRQSSAHPNWRVCDRMGNHVSRPMYITFSLLIFFRKFCPNRWFS